MTKALREDISCITQNPFCYSKLHEEDRSVFCKLVSFLLPSQYFVLQKIASINIAATFYNALIFTPSMLLCSNCHLHSIMPVSIFFLFMFLGRQKLPFSVYSHGPGAPGSTPECGP